MLFKGGASRLFTEIEKTRDGWLTDADYCATRLAGFRAQAIAKLRAIRFPHVETPEIAVYQWDGLRLSIPPVPKKYIEASGSHPSCILHDLAHWAVCPDVDRRAQPEFGLGPASETTDYALREQVSEEVAVTEEEKASLLGVLMEYDLGMPAGATLAVHDTYTDPDYFFGAGKYQAHFRGREATVNWFRGAGLVNADWTVNWAGIARGVTT